MKEKGRKEKKEKMKKKRRRRGLQERPKVRKSSFCMELVWFWVWKLRFLYGLLWVSVNLWTFILNSSLS